MSPHFQKKPVPHSEVIEEASKSFKNLQISNSGNNRFIVSSDKNPIIDGLNSWKQVAEFSKILLSEYNNSLSKIPFRVHGFTTIKSIFEYYQSQGRGIKRKVKREVIKTIAFRKAEANRAAIESGAKKIDNLRYAIARAYNLASSNLLPVGVWPDSFSEDVILYLLDRGNLFEFLSGSENKDEFWSYSKKQIVQVFQEFIDELGDKCPAEIVQSYLSFSNQPAKISLFMNEIIDDECWESILNEVVPFNFLIAHEDVCVNEMKNFNGKSFPWSGPVFLIQYMMTKNKIDVNTTLEYFADTKLGTTDESVADYVIREISPEGCIETGFVYGALYPITRNKTISFNSSSEAEDVALLKEIFTISNPTKIKSKENIDEFYKEYLTGDSKIAGTDIKHNPAKTNLPKKFTEEWKSFTEFLAKFWEHKLFSDLETKGKNLEVAWDVERERLKTHAKANGLTVTLPEHPKNRLLMPGQCSSATDFKVTLLYGVYKILKQKQKNEDGFIDDILNKMFDYLYGDDVIKIIKSKGDFVNYSVISDEFQEWLSSDASIGYGTKALWIYKALFKLNDNLELILGGKADDNKAKKDREYRWIMDEVLNGKFTEAVWYVESTNGAISEVGIKNGSWTSNTSWEHCIDGKSERWEDGYFEEVSVNSGRGKSAKPQTKLDGYTYALNEQQRLLDADKITQDQFDDSDYVLRKIISSKLWSDIESYNVWKSKK
jgi:hypothetical protein